MSQNGIRSLPEGCHYEIRRCLIARCRGEELRVGNWETVKCYFSAAEVPSYDDYMANRLFARTYPHVSLVIVSDSICREPFGPRTGGFPARMAWL